MSKFIIIALLAACSSTNETITPTGSETVNTETTNKTVNDVKTTPVSNSTGSTTSTTTGNSQKVEDQKPAVKEFVKKSLETSETIDAKTDTTSATTESKE